MGLVFGICSICVWAVAIMFACKFDNAQQKVAIILLGLLSFGSLLALIQWSVWMGQGCRHNGFKLYSLDEDEKMDIGSSTALVIAGWCLGTCTTCIQCGQTTIVMRRERFG